MAALDRCIFLPTSTGTGDFTVASALTGYQTPAAAGAVSTYYRYAAQTPDVSQWEVGVGLYNTGTGVLSRVQVRYSTNSNNKVNFTSIPQVAVTPLTDDLFLDCFVDASWFLPDPTGVTDSTTALQAAINFTFGGGVGTSPVLVIPFGLYTISSPLQIIGVEGIAMRGAGKMATTIQNPNNTGVIYANACAFSLFEDMQLKGASNSDTLFDLDWDGSTGPNSTQGNVIRNMAFQNAAVGLRMGISGFQVSENLIEGCYVANCNTDGISTNNFNVLNNSVIGCSFEQNNTHLHVYSGSMPTITGNAFEHSSNFDIEIDNSGKDTYCISGCRSEGVNFLNAPRGNCVIIGCEHTNGNPGTFVNIQWHNCTIIGSTTVNGMLTTAGGSSASYLLQTCEFKTVNWSDGNSFGRMLQCSYGDTSDAAGTTFVYDSAWYGSGTAIQLFNPFQDSIGVLTAPYTLTSTTNEQKLFNVSTTGAVTLYAATYLFEGLLNITGMSATSGNAEIDILGAGTAVVTGALWYATGLDTSTPTTSAAWNTGIISGTASGAAIVPAATGTALALAFRGSLQVTTAGTLIPSITLANAAAAVVAEGSYIHFTPLITGAGSFGNWS